MLKPFVLPCKWGICTSKVTLNAFIAFIFQKSVHQHCVLIRRSVSVMELVVGNVCVLKDIREERRFAKVRHK